MTAVDPRRSDGDARPGPSVADLAEDWLAARSAASRSDPTNSDRARRTDLCRIGRTIQAASGDSTADGPLSLETDCGPVRLADLSVDALAAMIGELRRHYEPATVERTVSTLRGFTRWLARRGHLDRDPCDDDTVTAGRRRAEPDGPLPFHAFSAADVDALLSAAADPPAGARSAWAKRDVAIIATLAGTGLRAGELAALRVKDLDETVERPLLRVVRGTKGGRRRDIPVPRATVALVHEYAGERAERALAEPALAEKPGGPLFVRSDGAGLNQQWLDRLTRRCAAAAHVHLPGDAATHAYRHHYGVQLALRGVPVPVIQQLMGHVDPRTTSIYTRAAARDLVDPLDDAGWL